MKKTILRLSIFTIFILTCAGCNDVTDSTQNLGTLEPAILVTSQPYCRYKLTEVKCEQPTQFVVGDIICIECCTKRTPPWPKKVTVNNNCPKTIEFSVADGNGCNIKAKRLGQTCTNCNAKETKSVLKCPNP